MYWWRIDSLKKILATRSLTESEAFPYLLADIIITSLALIPIPGSVYNRIDVYMGIISAVIMTAGTYYVYLCNGGKGGQEFLQRLFALGWVVGVRYAMLVFLPLLVLFLFFVLPFYEDMTQTTWLDAIAILCISSGFFWVLGKHMKSLVRLKQGENQSVVTA